MQKLSLRYRFCPEDRDKLIQTLGQPECWVTVFVMLGEVTKLLVGDQVPFRSWHKRGRLQRNLSQGNWGLPVKLSCCWMKLTRGCMGMWQIFIKIGCLEEQGSLRTSLKRTSWNDILYFWWYRICCKASMNHTPGKALLTRTSFYYDYICLLWLLL